MACKVRWKGLHIESVKDGGLDDKTGTVIFSARFRMAGQEQVHREISQFRKEGGRWLYVNGNTNPPVEQRHVEKIGRNDPCFCGSGKKYKKCCGA